MIDLPQKIVCVGLNYRDHAEEQGVALPERPLLFAKWPNTLISSGDAIRIPAISKHVDYEAELGVVIGKRASRVSDRRRARPRARLRRRERRLRAATCSSPTASGSAASRSTRSCRSATSSPASDVPDPQALGIRAILNGEVMQDSSTANMVFGVAEIVAFVSQGITLEPGDLILTGTPAGVGAFRDPKVWLQPGDEITIEIDGIGLDHEPRHRRLTFHPSEGEAMSFVLVVRMKAQEGNEERALELARRARRGVARRARLRGLRPLPSTPKTRGRSSSTSSTATRPHSRSTGRPSTSSGSRSGSSSG